VWIFVLASLPHRRFAATYIDFWMVLGIEWALTVPFMLKNDAFDATTY
jgi:hypothetical protein